MRINIIAPRKFAYLMKIITFMQAILLINAEIWAEDNRKDEAGRARERGRMGEKRIMQPFLRRIDEELGVLLT